MAIASSSILCLAIGYLITLLCLGDGKGRTSHLLLRFCLGIGWGLGLFSIIYFLARVSGVMALWRIELALCALLVAGYLTARRPRRSLPPEVPHQLNAAPPLLNAAFLLALAAAVYAAVARALQRPYGSGWDSFAIWNLHARFLFRGGAHWHNGFNSLIPWSHPDYPLLVPAAIAHFWTIAGHETTAVPTVLGLVFTFATVGLLFSALDILCGRTSALLGGMALLCTPFFIDLGTWQYADIPLSFYILATLVLLQTDERSAGEKNSWGTLAMAGLACGLAAWTKNEGLLFLYSVLFARVFFAMRRSRACAQRGGLPQIVPLLFTVIPLFCVVAYFKRFIAPPGDLFSTPAIMLHKVADPARYWAVVKWYAKEFLRFGDWLLIPIPLLMVAFYFLLRRFNSAQSRHSIATSAFALGLTLLGYFVVYLITPHEIYWHLRFSLNRLFMQLWPGAVFLFFLKVDLEQLYGVQESAP